MNPLPINFIGNVYHYTYKLIKPLEKKMSEKFIDSTDQREKEKISWLMGRKIAVLGICELFDTRPSEVEVEDSSILEKRSRCPDVIFLIPNKSIEAEVKSSGEKMPSPLSYQHELENGYNLKRDVVFIGIHVKKYLLILRIGKINFTDKEEISNVVYRRISMDNFYRHIGEKLTWRKRKENPFLP